MEENGSNYNTREKDERIKVYLQSCGYYFGFEKMAANESAKAQQRREEM
jgi:hypothetical protein